MRSEWETNRAIAQYADMVRRICLCHLKNSADTEDIFQKVFLKYLMTEEDAFADEAHEKAWFIRVSLNACKDHLKSLFCRRSVSFDALTENALVAEPEHREVLEAVLALPEKYRTAIYLHYYEGYSAAEIARLTSTRENTVYSQLSRGRALLKDLLGGDTFAE